MLTGKDRNWDGNKGGTGTGMGTGTGISPHRAPLWGSCPNRSLGAPIPPMGVWVGAQWGLGGDASRGRL